MGIDDLRGKENPNFGLELQEAASELARLQNQSRRDFSQEDKIASRPIDRINAATRNWHSDFSPTVTVKSTGILRSDYYYPSIVNKRAYLQDNMERFGYNFDLDKYLEKEIHTYLGGFHRGTEMGYEEILGDKWFLTLSDNRGTYYCPVDQIKEIQGIGF